MNELLIIAYWYHAGLHGKAPEWVKKHPMWPDNNDIFHLQSSKGPMATAVAGRDRLWEAIAASAGIDYNKEPTCTNTAKGNRGSAARKGAGSSSKSSKIKSSAARKSSQRG